MTLTAMRGYPASGKTTIANDLATKTGGVVVNRDSLRKMLHDDYFTGKAVCEDEVTIAERATVRAFLQAGKNVIVDATHLNAPYLRKWSKLAAEVGADFEVFDVATPVDICLKRDFLRAARGERSVGPDVLAKMAKRWPIKSWPEVRAQVPFEVIPVGVTRGLPDAIIVDIDGTVAHMNGRSPYDYSQVHTDTVDLNVAWLVQLVKTYYDDPDKVKVLFCSGRDDSCREATELWLRNRHIPYDELFMRPSDAKESNGNKLPDYKVKYQLFNENIRGKYNIRFVLDDRNQVVNLWRRLGLQCFQVAEGDF